MLLSCLAYCWLCSFGSFGFPCCWVCSSRGPRTHVAFFLLLTTGSLAVVLSLLPPASLCGSLRRRGSLLSPPTALLSIEPLRDCCFEVDALVPRQFTTTRSADNEDWFLFSTLLLLHLLG